MLKKLISVDALDIQGLFPNGSYIGWSGFTGVGYPKFDSLRPISSYHALLTELPGRFQQP